MDRPPTFRNMRHCVRLLATVLGLQNFNPSAFQTYRPFIDSYSYFINMGYAFFTGRFVGFIAGFLNSFRAVSFFIILDDYPIIRLIFQKGESIIQNFNIGSFQFDLMQMLNESCIYRVRNENFNMLMFFYGIDKTRTVITART